MLRISPALCLLTIGFPAGDAVGCPRNLQELILHVHIKQHAFKRLTSYGKYGSYQQDYTKMLGEEFFKHGQGEKRDNDDNIETLPYEVLKTYEVREGLKKVGNFPSPQFPEDVNV